MSINIIKKESAFKLDYNRIILKDLDHGINKERYSCLGKIKNVKKLRPDFI